MTSKVVNQGNISWLVTKDDNDMVNWVLRGQLPGLPEYVIGKGFTNNIKNANANMANEAVLFMMKNRSR